MSEQGQHPPHLARLFHREFINAAFLAPLNINLSRHARAGKHFFRVLRYGDLFRVQNNATGVKIFAEARKAIGSCNGAAAAAASRAMISFFTSWEKLTTRPPCPGCAGLCMGALDIPVFQMGQTDPVDIARAAIEHARQHGNDMVFLDTAGRLHVDEELMDELKRIKAAWSHGDPAGGGRHDRPGRSERGQGL